MSNPEFEQDGDVTWINDGGHGLSAVSLSDPGLLVFEYAQQMALCVDAVFPGDGALRVTHVGGAGLTMARWIHHTRPGSPQIAFEPDTALTEAVRRELPLPRGIRLRVRPLTGEEGIAGLGPASADLILLDAFDEGRVPAGLSTLEWCAEVDRVLAPGGLFLANVGDLPGLRYASRFAAGLREALGAGPRGTGAQTAYVGLHHVLKGKGFGNVIIVASRDPLPLFEMRRGTARLALPTGVVAPSEVLTRGPGAQPFSAASGDTSMSPAPPA